MTDWLGMYVIMVFILSGLKEALLAERRQRLKLEELDKLKNQLLGVAAHDLRSPIAIISMYAEMLREKSSFMLRLIGRGSTFWYTLPIAAAGSP